MITKHQERMIRASEKGLLKSNQFDTVINGVFYDSIAEASRILAINYQTLIWLSKQPQPCRYKGKVLHIHRGDRTMKTSKRRCS